jgi:hypothetical protein
MFAITLSVERRRAAVAPKSRLLGHTDGSRAAAIVVLSVLGVYCVRVCRRNRPHENVEDARDDGRGRERVRRVDGKQGPNAPPPAVHRPRGQATGLGAPRAMWVAAHIGAAFLLAARPSRAARPGAEPGGGGFQSE